VNPAFSHQDGRHAFRSIWEEEKSGKSREIGISGLGRFSSSSLFICPPLFWKNHMKSLGTCWIAYGIFRVLLGIAQILFAPTATVMFGALLGRVADPFTLMGIFHVLYVGAIVLSFVCGVLGIAGGVALAGGRGSGRGMLVAASVLSASNLPIGIALSVFTLVRLLPGNGNRAVERA
jgi:hypothetical protein